MKNKLVLFILGFIIWLLLSWSFEAQHIVIGLFVSGLVAYLTGDLFTRRPHHFLHATRYFWFAYYIPVFLWECIKANIEVAIIVIHPKLPLKPGIVKVTTTLKSSSALTFLANSITLTPGTLCVDINAQEGVLYVHWINVKSQQTEEATRIIVDKFEKILKRIFE